MADPESCPRCLKPLEFCVCAELKPHPSRVHVLILQHPQEPDKELGSARLAHLGLENSTLRIGLSWPNLKGALKNPDIPDPVPARWGVLYLGSGPKAPPKKDQPLVWLDKNAIPTNAPPVLDGIVVLDGTWSQAKALWWRNAWLLKLRRAILHPNHRSLYKELRKEPRKECLSTIETIADTLDALGEAPATTQSLRAAFARLLEKKRAQKPRA